MEAAISQGSSPTMGPSQNDWDTLLVGHVANDTQAVCVAGDTLVLTTEGEIEIRNLLAGSCLLCPTGEQVLVSSVVKLPSWEKFIVIPAGSLGERLPNRELRIRPGHPILLSGREVLPETLIGNQSCDCCQPIHLHCDGKQRADVFSIITEKRSFVLMQGLPVATWSAEAWENFKQNDFGLRLNAHEQ